MSTDAEIVAALITKGGCDNLKALLLGLRPTADYQRLGFANSVANFGSAEGRAAEISRLTAKNAAGTLEIAARAESQYKAEAKLELSKDETRLNNLVLKTYTQGGDDKAERMFDGNTAKTRVGHVGRVDELLPLVAARKAALPS